MKVRNRIRQILKMSHEAIMADKRSRMRLFIAFSVFYLMELVLCALGVVSIKLGLCVLELTAIVGLGISIYIDKHIDNKMLSYKDMIINLKLRDKLLFSNYMREFKAQKECCCKVMKHHCWIHFFILIFSLILNFAMNVSLDVSVRIPESHGVVINNTIVMPNDSTIVLSSDK